MNTQDALDPRRSCVVEACAGSGKTWLLVSRIVRLLLEGVPPAQILAITFTRKAAQEMRARLQLWLRDLCMGDDGFVRDFCAARGLQAPSALQLQRARELYGQVLLAQPSVTISTFHGWFKQVMQRAPLNADVMQGASLLERSASVQEEAWEELLEQMRRNPNMEDAKHMQWLFEECGLHNTRTLLFNFLGKRAEWWAYVQIEQDALKYALDALRSELGVDLEFDPIVDWGECDVSEELLVAFIRQLADNGTDVQKEKASELERVWSDTKPEMRFERIWPLLFTQKNEPRTGKPIAPGKNQDATLFVATRNALQASLQGVHDTRAEQQAYLLNIAVLHCGVALLAHYQKLKQQKQQMDFSDLEWQLCRLLQHSEHAETMQYKLDSRYRHVLLDEFQDTNPLQWQILRAWFDAAVTVELQPTVFVVGDPKQSIYRFRRADARLFGQAREYLKTHFAAHDLRNNHTYRNSPIVLEAVNAVFSDHPAGFIDFEPHTAEHADLPGCVKVLPLALAEQVVMDAEKDRVLSLRDPLTTPRMEKDEGARHKEAVQFAEQVQSIVSDWSVNEEGRLRRATYGDIMVLVRGRTHLAVYEEALRLRHIPFLSSRRGGLLDTLEAEDMQALLLFLITPFADLALAQVLRTPIFGCSDADLMVVAAHRGTESWWERLQQLDVPTPALHRARNLLQGWLMLADRLPVHDLLDRVYFEGEVMERYAAILPPEIRAKVTANLHAFMKVALSVDAGRYPSLPRFLQELRELRNSPDDAPDEGRLGVVGDAVRIYTVHEAKGLEAPIVCLLDANAEARHREGYDVLIDWPTQDTRPRHFSVYTDYSSRGRLRSPLFEQDEAQQAREDMNLLYVAMTRAQQVLVVSGNSRSADRGESKRAPSWYDRIAAVCDRQDCSLLAQGVVATASRGRERTQVVILPPLIAAGQRIHGTTARQQRGIWLHALLQHVAGAGAVPSEVELRQRVAMPEDEFAELWPQVRALLAAPHLAHFFDARHYLTADNELSYVDAAGEIHRIDRLVEFGQEVWVLDYKLGERIEADRYRTQMLAYRDAMRAVYQHKEVRCALLFAEGELVEVT